MTMPGYINSGRTLDQLREMANTLDQMIITCQGLRIQVSGMMQKAIDEKSRGISLREDGHWGNCENCQCFTCSLVDNGCTERRDGITNENACPCDGCEDGLPYKPKDGTRCPKRIAQG